MSKSENNEQAVALFFVVAFILYVIAQVILFLIGLARVIFWVSITGFVISFCVGIYYLISWITSQGDPWKEDYWIPALIALGVCLLLYTLAGISYQLGYSEDAIKTEMQAKGYINWYEQFTNIPNQAIEETINSLCKDPNYPCEDAKRGYAIYQGVVGFKEAADKISLFLKITNKMSK